MPALEEAIAEKLAAWRRRHKIRDLYDLYWFGQGPLDQALVRRTTVLKVFHDVVVDNLGTAPFDPHDLIADIDVRRMPPENIGLFTQPVEPDAWLAAMRQRFTFIVDLDPTEAELARCRHEDRWRAKEAAADLPRLT